MGSPTAILEPQITLESVSDDQVILNALPEWKKKLIDFLKYAATTDDEDVDCFVTSESLDTIRKKIIRQRNEGGHIRLSKSELSRILSAFVALSSMNYGDFYDYPPDDYDRLHDDICVIFENVFGKKLSGSKRIKTSVSGEFYG
ncbi:MAG: hypothetical protein COA45_10935 [Zetaproteobacteria bacterium]|nr:MAG: hypothetical protein COA45_10935 [Zetaproteobacteria bacterium]